MDEYTERMIIATCKCGTNNRLTFTCPATCKCGAKIEVGEDGKVHGYDENGIKFKVPDAHYA